MSYTGTFQKALRPAVNRKRSKRAVKIVRNFLKKLIDLITQITFFTRARVSAGAVVGSIVIIKFSNGFELKCTPDQRIMLIDGTYQYAAYLNEFDEIKDPKDDQLIEWCLENILN